MVTDRLKKERQQLWLVSGSSAAEMPVFTPPEAVRGNSDGEMAEHDRRSFELREPWPSSYDVLTIARASSGI